MWLFCSTACKLTLDPGLTECSKTIKFNKFYIIESMSLNKSVTAKYYNSPLRIQNSLRLRCLLTFFKWQILLRIGWMLWTLLSNNPPSALPSTLALKVKSPYRRIKFCQKNLVLLYWWHKWVKQYQNSKLQHSNGF